MEKEKKEITIVYGREIRLTTVGKKNKEVFLKISPAFKNKQLRELKGAPLSVFICYALHSDDEGYSYPDDKLIKKETGYSITTEIRQKLIKAGYLYQERLRNKEGQVKDYIYRIFQEIEPNKKFIIRGEELWTPVKEKPCSGENPVQGKDGGVIEEEPVINKEKPNILDKPIFVLSEEIKKLLNSSHRHIQIIGLWIKEMGLKPENKDQLQSIVKRNLRPAMNLKGYSNETIIDTLKVLKQTPYLTKITLETVAKFIDEIVKQKAELKNQSKLKGWKRIIKDGREYIQMIYEK